MAAEFALAVVQETLERLDSCQNGDYSGILLQLEYLNRTIIHCGDLPYSIVAGIGSAIACLLSAHRLSISCTYRANRLLTGSRGRPPFDVSRPSNRGNIFVQLVAQHCCKVLLPVLPPPQATCQISGFVAKSRTEIYFVQHVAATCNTEICCATSCLRGWQYGQQSFATMLRH